jgi:hypothetical protein
MKLIKALILVIAIASSESVFAQQPKPPSPDKQIKKVA